MKILFLTLLPLFPLLTFALDCRLRSEAIIIEETDKQTHKLWELKSSAVLWSSLLPQGAEFSFYRDRISLALDTDPIIVLENQYPIFANDPRVNMQREGMNIRAIIDEGVGKIKKANCLENLLVEEQTKRLPLAEYPYEFIASVLKKDIEGVTHIKVYLSTSATEFQNPKEDLFKSDIIEGWQLYAFIHNHPFHLTKFPHGLYQGLMAPSINDVQFGRHLVKDYKLENFLITNGFHTLYLSDQDLQRLFVPL